MPITTIPVGGYEDMTEPVTAAAKAEISANFDLLLALIPDTSHPNAQNYPPSGAAPLYDKIPPELANALRAEIEALRDTIDAADTA